MAEIVETGRGGWRVDSRRHGRPGFRCCWTRRSVSPRAYGCLGHGRHDGLELIGVVPPPGEIEVVDTEKGRKSREAQGWLWASRCELREVTSDNGDASVPTQS